MELISEALRTGLFLLVIVFVPLGLQIGLLHYLTRHASAQIVRTFGWRMLLALSWVGTPVHELSHALAVVVTGGRVKKIELFKANQATGELGSVSYTFSGRAPVRRAVVAAAPLAGGTLALLLVSRLLLPQVFSLATTAWSDPGARSLVEMLSAVGSVLGRRMLDLLELLVDKSVLSRWQTWLWAYLVVCIGTRLSPSAVDFRHMRPFLAIAAGLCLLGGLGVSLFERYGGVVRGPVGARRILSRVAEAVISTNHTVAVTVLFCVFAAGVLMLVALPFRALRGR